MIWSNIFVAVEGVYGYNITAEKRIDSIKLYNTVAKRSFLVSSLANTHGIVSSIYLFVLLNKLKISSKAFDAFNSSILAIALPGIARAKSFNSWSTSSHTFLFSTIPSKYLLDIAIVLLTKFPKTLARSLLILSTNKSHVILPSLS